MSFLMLLIFGFVHMSMLATTKYLVDFAAFSGARSVLVGRSAQAGATAALSTLEWSSPSAQENTQRTIRGATRTGITVQYAVPFGGIFNVPVITGFAPALRQPDIPEVGDNAD